MRCVVGERTGIAWTDATWNPWQGCEHASPGCDNCYMFRDKRRYGQDPTRVVRSAPATFNAVLNPKKYPPGRRVFTTSWSDWFHKDADPFRDEAWAIVDQRRDLTFQIPTKRHGRIASHLPATWGEGWPHVWLGVSVESREWLRRVDVLREVPAAVRFLSIEPQLEGIRLRGRLDGIRWVIVGGESGAGARPFDAQWARDIIDDCREAGVAVFVKQMGANVRDGDFVGIRLRDKAGADPEEWPPELRVREFPAVTP